MVWWKVADAEAPGVHQVVSLVENRRDAKEVAHRLGGSLEYRHRRRWVNWTCLVYRMEGLQEEAVHCIEIRVACEQGAFAGNSGLLGLLHQLHLSLTCDI